MKVNSITANKYIVVETIKNSVGLIAILCLVLCVSDSCADIGQQDVNKVIQNINVENGDSRAIVSWEINEMAAQATSLKGFRLYLARNGTEITFGISQFRLLVDFKKVKSSYSYRLTGLRNGEIYCMQLKAYDFNDKEIWLRDIITLPGTRTKGAPETPASFYGAEGDGKLAIFWQRNLERDLSGYEVFRRCNDENEYRKIINLTKIVKLEHQQKDQKYPKISFPIVLPSMYIDVKVKNGDSCTYRVRAYDTEGLFSEFTEAVTLRPRSYAPPTPDQVILIVNSWIRDSGKVARYYAEKRKIPKENIIHLPIRTGYDFDYEKDLQRPLQKYMLEKKIAGKISYLIPCFGVPVRGADRAVDSKLVDLFDRFTWGRSMGTVNPFFGSVNHFDSTYGLYLVSRVDGPTAEIARGLVDKALVAESTVTARSGRGVFVNDESGRNLKQIGDRLGVKVDLKPHSFSATELLPPDTYWYFAWRHQYKSIRQDPWPAGAVASHLISYSFSGGFKELAAQNRNWVQGLLEDGITGTFGAIIEPYLQGYTRADIFFEHFWSGNYTFAEAFLVATPTVQWAMSAVGDPLFRIGSIQTTSKP